jgi:RNA polymerase sigma factor (sigma-70 family)
VYRSIRRALARPLRRLTDSDDIAQSVWRSFFTKNESFLLSASPGRIHAYLRGIANHKTIDHGRRFFRQQKRLDACIADAVNDPQENCSPKRRIPTPSEQLIAQESLDRLTESLPEKFQDAIRKRAEGASISEISTELGISLRSFHRIIRSARDRFVE